MSSHYQFTQYEIRLIACENCGNPLDPAQPNSSVNCRNCQAPNMVPPRDERVWIDSQPNYAVTENDRIIRLRAQDGRPMLPPPALQALLSQTGKIEDWKLQEAQYVWHSTRKEVQATLSPDAAERLFFLSIALQQYFSQKEDVLRQRVYLECVLDTLRLPRHRQWILCSLSRMAVKYGNLEAGTAWLKNCDAHSDDLSMDSSYRVSQAFLSTAYNDYRSVIELLGQTPDEIPIYDSFDTLSAILRANAFEKMGDITSAVNLLRHRMQTGGAIDRQVLKKIIDLTPNLYLCAQSFPQAYEQHTDLAARRAGTAAGGGIGFFFYMGLFFLIVTGVLLALIVAGIIPTVAAPGLIGGFGITGLVFTLLGRQFKKSAAKAAFLRIHGLQGTGTIDGIRMTGTRINNVPMVEVVMTIYLQNGTPPYQASTRMLNNALMGVPQGASLPVRVHPQNLTEFMIEIQ